MGNGARANVDDRSRGRLLLVNVGGSTVASIDKACHGFPGKISFCFGENEEESPWRPLHVERGFAPDDSTVTVIGAQGTSNIIVHGELTAADLLPTLAHGMINAGANNFALGPGEPLLVLNPGHARALAADGVDRTALREYLFRHARVPIEWYPSRAQEKSFMAERAIDGHVPITDRPERIMVVVARRARLTFDVHPDVCRDDRRHPADRRLRRDDEPLSVALHSSLEHVVAEELRCALDEMPDVRPPLFAMGGAPRVVRFHRGPADLEDELVRPLDAPQELGAQALGVGRLDGQAALECLDEVVASSLLTGDPDDLQDAHAYLLGSRPR